MLNGLCGGWSIIHRNYPKWFEELWAAITTWKSPEHEKPEDDLADLERHLAKVSFVGDSKEGTQQLVNLLTTAWHVMGEAEGGYEEGGAPGKVLNSSNKEDPDKWVEAVPIATKETLREPKQQNAESAITCMQKQLEEHKHGETGMFIFEISTEAHYMSLRVTYRGEKAASLVLLEPEKTGVAKFTTWKAMVGALDLGIATGRTTTEGGKVREHIEPTTADSSDEGAGKDLSEEEEEEEEKKKKKKKKKKKNISRLRCTM